MKTQNNSFYRKYLLPLILCGVVLSPIIMAQTPNSSWISGLGGNNNVLGTSIDTDASGNIFTIGYFEYTADFDPGSNNFFLTSNGNTEDFFVSKYSSNSTLIWALQVGGSGNDFARSIAVSSNGDIYITGHFEQTVDFDPGTNVYNLTSAGSSDIFVLKLDSNGAFQWARRIGGSLPDAGTDIAIDESGNVYVTGFFEATIDFNPTGQSKILTAPGVSDAFVLKLMNNGSFAWAVQLGGAGTNEGLSIALDTSGNIYSTGYFDNTSDFDPGYQSVKFTALGFVDIYISKLDNNGNFIWAKHIGGTNFERSEAIDVDDAGNVAITGFFNGTVDFDPNIQTYNLTPVGFSWEDAFVAKYDTNGALLWAQRFGDLAPDRSQSVKMDKNGNVYLTGYFNGWVDFDPGQSNHTLSSMGTTSDAFILKLDNQGNFVWVYQTGGSAAYVYPSELIYTTTHNIYTIGYFDGYIDFSPANIPGNQVLTSLGRFDAYIHKLNITNSSTNEIHETPLFTIFNRDNGIIDIHFNNTYDEIYLNIYSSVGTNVYQYVYKQTTSATIHLNLTHGMYILNIDCGKGKIANAKVII